MPSVVKHAWTHLADGSDPLPVGGFQPMWAHAQASNAAIPDSGTTYDFAFHDLIVGPAGIADAAFSTAGPGTDLVGDNFEWLQINEPGHYLMSFGIYWAESGEFPTGGFIQPSFSLSGGRAQITGNSGLEDHPGPIFSSVYYSTPGTALEKLGLYSLWFVQWNPADPASSISSLSYEDPLLIGVSFALAGGAADYDMSASVYVQKIADPGYTVLHSP